MTLALRPVSLSVPVFSSHDKSNILSRLNVSIKSTSHFLSRSFQAIVASSDDVYRVSALFSCHDPLTLFMTQTSSRKKNLWKVRMRRVRRGERNRILRILSLLSRSHDKYLFSSLFKDFETIFQNNLLATLSESMTDKFTVSEHGDLAMALLIFHQSI